MNDETFAKALCLLVFGLLMAATLFGCGSMPVEYGDPEPDLYLVDTWLCGNVEYECAENTGPPLTRALQCELLWTGDQTFIRPEICGLRQ